MDPNETLATLRGLALRILRTSDAGNTPDQGDVIEMAEQFDALDTWISGAGFLPEKWQA